MRSWKKIIVTLVFLWILLVTIFLTVSSKSDFQYDFFNRQIEISYMQQEWNQEFSFTYWRHTNVVIKYTFNGSIVGKLSLLSVDGQQSILAYHNNTELKRHYVHVYKNITLDVATKITLSFIFNPPIINASDPLGGLVLEQKSEIDIAIAAHEDPLNGVPLDLFFFVLTLFFLFLILLTIFIHHKNIRRNKKNKSLSPEEKYDITDLKNGTIDLSNQVRWAPYLFNLQPDIYFVVTTFYFIVLLLLNTLTFHPEIPSSQTLLLKQFIMPIPFYQRLLLYMLLGNIILFGIFGYTYLDMNFLHFWSYPNIRSMLFYQVSMMNIIVLTALFFIMSWVHLVFYTSLFVGISIISHYSFIYINGMIQLFLIELITLNLIISTNNLLKQKIMVLSLILFVISLNEFTHATILSITRLFIAWDQNQMNFHDLFLLLILTPLSFLLLYLSFQKIHGDRND